MCPLQAPTPKPDMLHTDATTHTATDPHHRRRHMLSLLLLEYEGLLQEYLSCNWDRLAELAEANWAAVRWEGPVCVWHRSPSVPSVAESSDGESERGGVEGNPQFRRRLSSPALREEEGEGGPGGRCVGFVLVCVGLCWFCVGFVLVFGVVLVCVGLCRFVSVLCGVWTCASLLHVSVVACDTTRHQSGAHHDPGGLSMHEPCGRGRGGLPTRQSQCGY